MEMMVCSSVVTNGRVDGHLSREQHWRLTSGGRLGSTSDEVRDLGGMCHLLHHHVNHLSIPEGTELSLTSAPCRWCSSLAPPPGSRSHPSGPRSDTVSAGKPSEAPKTVAPPLCSRNGQSGHFLSQLLPPVEYIQRSSSSPCSGPGPAMV